MDQVLRGMIVFGCLVVGLFFLRFYRRSNDRLFLFFALSFILLAAERFTLAILETYNVPSAATMAPGDTAGPAPQANVRAPRRENLPGWLGAIANFPYWVRAFAYLLIIAGIVDKNLSARQKESSG